MSTPNQLSDTPRTDLAWAKTFEDDDDQCRAGNAATDMREACATFERELETEKTNRNHLIEKGSTLERELAALRTCGELSCDECNARTATLTAERDQLRADCENETKWAAHYLADSLAAKARAARAEAGETVALTNWNGALERAMKAEADLAALEQCHDANCRGVVKIAAELDTEREKAERYRLVTLKQDAELATERARLDWLESDAGVYWQWSSSALTIRRAVIDAAMKEDAK